MIEANRGLASDVITSPESVTTPELTEKKTGLDVVGATVAFCGMICLSRARIAWSPGEAAKSRPIEIFTPPLTLLLLDAAIGEFVGANPALLVKIAARLLFTPRNGGWFVPNPRFAFAALPFLFCDGLVAPFGFCGDVALPGC